MYLVTTFLKPAFQATRRICSRERENREKSNLIGMRQTLTTSPPNHIRFLLVRAQKNHQVENGLNYKVDHNFALQIMLSDSSP